MAARSVEAAYASATQGALIVRHPDPGMLRAAGKDRLDLLHRMSTNDVAGLPPGTIRRSVLTNPIGRIVDVIRVLSVEEEALLLTTPGRAEAVQKWLHGYIFFQDDVALILATEAWSEWGVYGPAVEDELSVVFPGLDFPGGESVARTPGAFVWKVDQPGLGGCHLLLDPAETQRVIEAWRGRGGEQAETAAYQILRIEAGLPEPVHEIRPDSIPLEVGLRQAISFTKGCYIGQEIIARMDSRGRQAHLLVGARLSDQAEPGERVYQDGRDVGQITSVAHSPAQGWIALASVRPNVLDKAKGRISIGPGLSPARAVPLPIVAGMAESDPLPTASTPGRD